MEVQAVAPISVKRLTDERLVLFLKKPTKSVNLGYFLSSSV